MLLRGDRLSVDFGQTQVAQPLEFALQELQFLDVIADAPSGLDDIGAQRVAFQKSVVALVSQHPNVLRAFSPGVVQQKLLGQAPVERQEELIVLERVHRMAPQVFVVEAKKP